MPCRLRIRMRCWSFSWMCPWMRLSRVRISPVRARIRRKNRRLPSTATGMMNTRIQARDGDSANRKAEAATSWTTVTRQSGRLRHRKSVTTRMSSSMRLTVSPLWKRSCPLQLLRMTWSNVAWRARFWACTTTYPSHQRRKTRTPSWTSMMPHISTTPRPREASAWPVAMSTTRLEIQTKARDAATSTSPARTITRTFQRIGRRRCISARKQVRNCFIQRCRLQSISA